LENGMAPGGIPAREARVSNHEISPGGKPVQCVGFDRRSSGMPRLTAWQLSTAKGLMLGRLSDRLSVGEVASVLSLSASYFVRSFTNTVGISPYRWLVDQRIAEARQLLIHTDIPLAQIALECGFADQSHFTNAFNRRAGTTPSRWRKGEGGVDVHVI